MAGCPVHHHGMAKARGCTPLSVSKFSKLFPGVNALAVTEEDARYLGGPGGLMHDFNGETADSTIPAGYIFFAQFIDHDVTLDVESDLRGAPLPDSKIAQLGNVRSASLDLDCVYGFGPEASPHVYDPARPGRLAVSPDGNDVARSPAGVALIGDPRNDENLFVSQMQLLFHLFHNRYYEERVGPVPGNEHARFEAAQEQVRYHYQWLVLFDFLKRLCDREVYKAAVTELLKLEQGQTPAFPYHFGPDAHGELTMPVEFSVAAYRVGHTMVRSSYAVNSVHTDVELFDEEFGTLGFTAVPEDLVVDWRYLLPVDPCLAPRMSKAVDTKFADELQSLPVVGSNNPVDRALAFRNLLRGNALSLASGQDVAAALQANYPSISPMNPSIPDPAFSHLSTATPLFYYLLAESEAVHAGERFGPVGSAILLEVFGGMLRHCSSFLRHDTPWQPDPCVSKERRGFWGDSYKDGFDRVRLVEDDDYYPFDLADVVRFVNRMD